jgi:formate C-acetyltransferase
LTSRQEQQRGAAAGYLVIPGLPVVGAAPQDQPADRRPVRRSETPDPALQEIEDVIETYLEQVRFFFDKMVKLENTCRRLYQEYAPRPFLSAFLDGCIEKGKDARKWAYPSDLNSFNLIIGPTNVADSLAAIKKLVFDDASWA